MIRSLWAPRSLVRCSSSFCVDELSLRRTCSLLASAFPKCVKRFKLWSNAGKALIAPRKIIWREKWKHKSASGTEQLRPGQRHLTPLFHIFPNLVEEPQSQTLNLRLQDWSKHCKFLQTHSLQCQGRGEWGSCSTPRHQDAKTTEKKLNEHSN